eukprot:superscaffoldBa00001715_g11736
MGVGGAQDKLERRVEHLWRDVWMAVTSVYYELLHGLEEDCLLDPSNSLHLFCAQYIFVPRLQMDRDTFTSGLGAKPQQALMANDLRMTIMTKLDTQHPRSRLPRLSDKVPSESLLEDVLIYTTATVILEMLGYKMNTIIHKEHYPPWRRRLEAKIKATQREVSQLSELQKGVGTKGIPRKYNKLSIPEALETAKQRLCIL